MSTLLETQYGWRASKPLLHPDKPGFIAVDAANPPAPPKGVVIDSEAIVTFATEQGADPEMLRYTAVALYPPESPLATRGIAGFCSKSAYWEAPEGVRTSLIYLKYDPTRPKSAHYERQLNFFLRHELRHLLQENKAYLYHRESLTTNVRLGGYSLSVLALDALTSTAQEGYATGHPQLDNLTAATLMGAGAVGVFLGSRWGTCNILSTFDSFERDANKFAKKYKDFNPITLVKN